MTPGWKCPRRVGFLFPHECFRTTPVGCPDCNNGQVQDPFVSRSDRYGYPDYDIFPMDFTEADGADLVATSEEFESDMSGS